MPAAIVLAGGRASRLGGVAKPDVRVGGRRMLDLVLEAVGADAGSDGDDGRAPVVVVAPGTVEVPDDVVLTLADPPFGGPACGVAAGLAALKGEAPADELLVLACDLPGAGAIVRALLGCGPLPDDADGAVLTRDDGSPDWLALRVRTASLARAVELLGDPRNKAMRRLLAPLVLHPVPAPGALARDVDTWSDHAAWEERHVGV
ncbi:MAG: molybdenum cofactor guanylyltransferase [Actinomycetaceae bacterium]